LVNVIIDFSEKLKKVAGLLHLVEKTKKVVGLLHFLCFEMSISTNWNTVLSYVNFKILRAAI